METCRQVSWPYEYHTYVHTRTSNTQPKVHCAFGFWHILLLAPRTRRCAFFKIASGFAGYVVQLHFSVELGFFNGWRVANTNTFCELKDKKKKKHNLFKKGQKQETAGTKTKLAAARWIKYLRCPPYTNKEPPLPLSELQERWE